MANLLFIDKRSMILCIAYAQNLNRFTNYALAFFKKTLVGYIPHFKDYNDNNLLIIQKQETNDLIRPSGLRSGRSGFHKQALYDGEHCRDHLRHFGRFFRWRRSPIF